VTTPRTLARVAGLLYLVVVVGGVFNDIYVRSRIVRSGDAAATADNIRASAQLYRIGFVGDAVAGACWLLTAMALYLLLRHVNQMVAAAMVTLVAVGAAVGSLNMLNQYTALTVATGEDYTRGLGAAGSDALTQLFVEAHHNGFILNAMFFGLWLAPLGYLVMRSGYVPRVLGVLLIIGCFGYLADFFAFFLAHGLGTRIGPLLAAVGGIPEILFVAWLLVRAVRVPAPDARVSPVTG